MRHGQQTISLVIPTYNEERYLPATLSSIRRLRRQPDEIIIVDSSSVDATARIARRFGARIISVAERGIGLARQIGLEAARGDIVVYTDADTLVPPLWLTHFENALSRQYIVAAYGAFCVFDGWLPYRLYANYINLAVFSVTALLGTAYATGQNIAFFRNAGLAAGGFPVDFQSVEDVEMFRRLSLLGKTKYLPDNVVGSSGRWGNEGAAMIPRKTIGLVRYLIWGRADTFVFPDFR